MDSYRLLRPLIFALDAEHAHDLTLRAIKAADKLGIPPRRCEENAQPTEVMGLEFPNKVGLAAGLDKNGEAIDALSRLGFGFIEIGTITPRPQPGNQKPRLFRLTEQGAIINRMGFNNHGIDGLLANLAHMKYQGLLGINIGKNAATPIERAVDDYLLCLERVYVHASYVTVNISSPNTKNLRQLQNGGELDSLLATLKRSQMELSQQHGRYVPLVLKIAPDLEQIQIEQIAGTLKRHSIDAVIATNTTLGRKGVESSPLATESGGLSGAPLFEKSTMVVKALASALAGELPIIASGGIGSAAQAQAKIDAGASLIQLYSGLIYRGPALVHECVNALR
jgi:dihydroorotate dehydrogenase